MTSTEEKSDIVSSTDMATLTVELPRALVERLSKLAGRTTWDISTYVAEALAGYLPIQEREIALTKAALAELDAGGPTYSHEEVMAWLESWETPDELPPPG